MICFVVFFYDILFHVVMTKIYTTPTCAYCKMAKEYFELRGFEYEEYNVAIDIEKQKEMIAKTGQFGVPVIDIDGKIVIGFDRTKINQYLGIK